MREENNRLSQELAMINKDYGELLKEYNKLVVEINSIYNSKSWKITKPLRKITNMLKRK